MPFAPPAVNTFITPHAVNSSPAAKLSAFLALHPSRTRTHHDAMALAKKMESSAWQLAGEALYFEANARHLSSQAQTMYRLTIPEATTFQLASNVAKMRTTQSDMTTLSTKVSDEAWHAAFAWTTIVAELERTQPRRDPIQVLPVELFAQVLDELDHNDFLRCTLVNSSWAAAASGYISSARANELSRRFLNNPGSSPARVTGPGTAVFRTLRAIATGNVQATYQSGAAHTVPPTVKNHQHCRNAADNVSRLFAQGMAQHTLHLLCDLRLVGSVPLQRRWKAVLPAFRQVRSLEVVAEPFAVKAVKIRAAAVLPTVELWPKLRKVTSTEVNLTDLMKMLGFRAEDRPITQLSLTSTTKYTLINLTGSRFLGPTGEAVPELKSLYFRSNLFADASSRYSEISVLTMAERLFAALARLDGSLSPQLSEVFTSLNSGFEYQYLHSDEVPHGGSEACERELWRNLCQPGYASVARLAKLDAARLALERFPRLNRWTLIIFRRDERSSVRTIPLVGKLVLRLTSGPLPNSSRLEDSVVWS